MSAATVVTTIAEVRAHLDERRAGGHRVGFVPTMGYLHEGHASLVARAAADNDTVLVSVFVNPLQFAADEDLGSYPRDFERDVMLAEAAGATLVFHPDVAEMYPSPVLTTVSVGELSTRFEGASRPTHFAGVATVVAKLFNIVGPCRAYFGEKDYQQLCVVRRMVQDLSMPVEVVGCPTARNPDGLALSSRNAYLTDEERAVAPVLQRALQVGRSAILEGRCSASEIEAIMANVVATEPLVTLDYAAVVDATDLTRAEMLSGEVRLLIAGKLGRPRLLDNVGVTVPS